MLTVLMQSVSNASFGIYFPKFVGTIYELLSAPISYLEIVIGFVGAAATKSLVIGLIIYVTANFFVTLPVAHPAWMLAFLALTCVSFSLFGFIIGIWAKNFEQLQLVPMLVISPLVFLGGSLLLDLHAAAGLADRHPLQPGGLPGLGLPLVVLRHRPTSASASRSPPSPASPCSASPSSGGSSAPATGSGPEARAYSQSGARFSRNAPMPSAVSSRIMFRAMTCPAWAYAASSPSSACS